MILGLLYSIVRSLLDLLVLCRKTEAALQIEVLALRHESVGRRPLRFDGGPYNPRPPASTENAALRTSFALRTYAGSRPTGCATRLDGRPSTS